MKTNKKTKFLIGFWLMVVSCDSVVNHTTEINEEIKIYDCDKSKDSARKELKRGNVFLLDTLYSSSARMHHLMNEKYQIIRDGHYGGTYDSCFTMIMDSFIREKYGADFYIKLKFEADKIDSVAQPFQNLDGTFFWCRKLPQFDTSEFSYDSFNSIRSKEYEVLKWITIMFTVDTFGKVKDPVLLRKFDRYHDSIALTRLKGSSWKPAEIKVRINGEVASVKVPFRHKTPFFILPQQ